MKSHGISNPLRFYRTPQASAPKLPSPSAATPQQGMINGRGHAVLCILATCTTPASARSSTRHSSICVACAIYRLTLNKDKAAHSCFRTACSRVCWPWWPSVSRESTVSSSCARCLNLLRSLLGQPHWSRRTVWSVRVLMIRAPMRSKQVTWSLECASSTRPIKRRKRRRDRRELTE